MPTIDHTQSRSSDSYEQVRRDWKNGIVNKDTNAIMGGYTYEYMTKRIRGLLKEQYALHPVYQ